MKKNSAFDLSAYIAIRQDEINKALINFLAVAPKKTRLMEAMEYSLMAGGKRLRPILCLAGARAVGGSYKDAMPAACAIEMIHTYSLIHDDLPAMDDDDLRRGMPTNHIKFGEATAILAGDALLTLAFQILSDPGIRGKTDPEKWLRIINEISVAAGMNGMIEGQMRDMDAEKNILDQDQLEAMHVLKTGALIKACVRVGAILGGADTRQIESLDRYGKYIGLAFQVKDDILNVEGDPDLMGKAVGTDKARNKSTYPSLMGLEKAKKFAENLVKKARNELKPFDSNGEALKAIASYILERKR